jgi:hypothetical protein
VAKRFATEKFNSNVNIAQIAMESLAGKNLFLLLMAE